MGILIHRVLPAIILALLFSLSAGCADKSSQVQEFTGDNFIMDTLVQISVYSLDPELGQRALQEAWREFSRINNLTDKFAEKNLPDPQVSDVYRINKNAGVRPVPVSEDTLAMLERCKYFSELSGGAFDPSIGPVMDLWGFGTKEYQVPSDRELKDKLALVGFDRVMVDEKKKTVFLPEKGMVLDLGSVAKGYATDMVVKKLREMGIKHAMINAGGNVYALGSKPDGSPWRVGIQDPWDEKGIIAVLNVRDTAVVSSGDYERYFIEGNRRYHHIMDPATGKPAAGLMETTIIARSSIDADALSTALFVLGQEGGKNLAKKLPEVGAVFVGANRHVFFSRGVAESLEFVEESGYQVDGGF